VGKGREEEKCGIAVSGSEESQLPASQSPSRPACPPAPSFFHAAPFIKAAEFFSHLFFFFFFFKPKTTNSNHRWLHTFDSVEFSTALAIPMSVSRISSNTRF
jgi:hypothetical protein